MPTITVHLMMFPEFPVSHIELASGVTRMWAHHHRQNCQVVAGRD